jgi:predicted transcriptional regulator
VTDTNTETWVSEALVRVDSDIDIATWTKENVAERRARVWRLRVLGYGQTEIGKQLGIPQPTVSADLKWCRDNLPSVFETIQDFRNISLARVEEMMLRVMTSDTMSEKDQVSAVTGLIDVQAKILGGYAPTKQEVGLTVKYQINGVDTEALT